MELESRKNILHHHRLRITDCRLDVLEFFSSSNHALSTRELEDALQDYDRVTLYRTLSSFVEKGILHSIPDDSGFARYGLCHDTCSPEDHRHDHVHFKCNDCGNMACIPDYHVPNLTLPGYIVSNTELIMSGICNTCNSK